MNGEISVGGAVTGSASARPRVIDLADAWRDAAADVADAYRAWAAAPPGHSVDGHAVYLAALEREAAAARYLGFVLEAAHAA